MNFGGIVFWFVFGILGGGGVDVVYVFLFLGRCNFSNRWDCVFRVFRIGLGLRFWEISCKVIIIILKCYVLGIFCG